MFQFCSCILFKQIVS